MSKPSEQMQQVQSTYSELRTGKIGVAKFFKTIESLLHEEYQRGYDDRNIEIIKQIGELL